MTRRRSSGRLPNELAARSMSASRRADACLPDSPVLVAGTAAPGLGVRSAIGDCRPGLVRDCAEGTTGGRAARVSRETDTTTGAQLHEARVRAWSPKDRRSFGSCAAGWCEPRHRRSIASVEPPVVSRETAPPTVLHGGAPGRRSPSRKVRWGFRKVVVRALGSTAVTAMSVRLRRLQERARRREPCE